MKLVIQKKKVKKEVYKNLYKLVIDNMHGDADATTYTEAFFKKHQESTLIDILEFLNWCQDKWPDRDKIATKFKSKFKLWSPAFEDGEDELNELIDYDQNGDCRCRPTLHKLTWFDDNGEECKVTIKK